MDIFQILGVSAVTGGAIMVVAVMGFVLWLIQQGIWFFIKSIPTFLIIIFIISASMNWAKVNADRPFNEIFFSPEQIARSRQLWGNERLQQPEEPPVSQNAPQPNVAVPVPLERPSRPYVAPPNPPRQIIPHYNNQSYQPNTSPSNIKQRL